MRERQEEIEETREARKGGEAKQKSRLKRQKIGRKMCKCKIFKDLFSYGFGLGFSSNFVYLLIRHQQKDDAMCLQVFEKLIKEKIHCK